MARHHTPKTREAPGLDAWLVKLALGLLIAAAAFAVYANSITARFVWNDDLVIVHNTAIRSLRNLPLLLSREHYASLFTEQSYRPVVSLTYFIDHLFFRSNARGYHAHNVLLHTAAAVLVFAVLGTLPISRGAAFAGGLLFAVHPAAAEVVNVPSFREDLLCLAFMLIGLLCFRRYRLKAGRAWLAGSTAALLVAMFSKESALMALPILVAYDVLVVRREAGAPALRWSSYIPVTAATLGYALVRFVLMRTPREAQIPYLGGSVWSALVSMAPVFARYAKLYLLPAPLSVAYDVRPHSLLSAPVLLAAGVLLAITAAAVLWSRRDRAAAFLWIWVACLLAPVSNVLPLGNAEADRYLYLPLVGVAGLIGLALFTRRAGRRPATSGLRIAGYATAVALLALLTIHRNSEWADSDAVWRQGHIQAPRLASPLYNVAKQHDSRHEFRQSIRTYQHAHALAAEMVRADPSDLDAQATARSALFNIAYAYQEDGQYAAALRRYRQLILTDNRPARAMGNMHNIPQHYWPADLLARGSAAHRQIERVFLDAIEQNQANIDARVALAKFYDRTGRLGDSARQLALTLREAPDYKHARELLRAVAVRLAGENWQAELARSFTPHELALASQVRGEVLLGIAPGQAMRAFEEAANADTGFALPCITLAEAYHARTLYAKEAQQLREALRRLPRHSPLRPAIQRLIRAAERAVRTKAP